MALLCAVTSLAWGETIESNFTDKNLTVGDNELEWTASIEASIFESANLSRGVQFGTGKGWFTLTSNVSLSNVTKVEIYCSTNGTANENAINVKVGETTFLCNSSDSYLMPKANDQHVVFEGSATTGTIVISLYDQSKSIWVKKIVVTYSPGSTPIVAAPTFSPAGGLYSEAQDVTITAADNCTISYTTDGSDPVESGTAVTTDGNTAIVNVNSTTTIKAVAMDTKLNFSEVATATYTIVSAYATLPFEFDGGASDIAGTEGLIQNGLGSDYSNKPYLKFNDTGDYLILRFNERPGTLSFDIRGWDFSGGTFTVQTSEDGTSYTDLETYTALSDTQSKEFNLNLDSYKDVRYIKWIYTNKSTGNVALGNISLLDYVDQTPYTLTITSNENSYIYAFDESNQSEALESPASVIPGTSILLSVDVSDGYKLESLNVVAENGSTVTVTENPEDKSYTFTMPESNVTVSCTVSEIVPVEGFYESFDQNSGAGGNDGEWNGSIAQKELITDLEGWDVSNGNGADQCAKFGTGSKKGSATTPALGITGDAKLTFKAAAWDASKESTQITVTISGGATPASTTIDMTKGAWTEYKINISGLTADSKITFSAKNTSNNRFFLDEVMVVEATAEPVEITIGSLGYASMYYGTLNLEVPTGVTATTYTLTADNNPAASKTYNEGDVIPAGEGVILQGNAGTYQFNIAASATEKDANNKLKGSDTEERTTGPAGETSGYLFYVLSTYQGKDPGFYWNTEDGSAFTSAAHKVYLPIPDTGNNVAAFSFDGMNGINETMLSVNANEDVYTISGVKVNAQQLQKGLYIINGKKVVIK